MQRSQIVFSILLPCLVWMIAGFRLSAQSFPERYQPETVGFYVYAGQRKPVSEGKNFSFLQKNRPPEPVLYRHPATLPWSDECLPFFCRIEKKLAVRLARPVKFRLGSVDYVDWLEGKGGGDYWPYVR